MRKLYTFIVFILLGTLVFNLCSCKEVEYIPVTTTKTDSIYIVKERKDSVVIHDSVYVETFTKGDTVFQVKYKGYTEYVPRYVIDTLVNYKVDTLRVPYKVVETVVKTKTPIFTKILAWIGALALILLVFTIILDRMVKIRT